MISGAREIGHILFPVQDRAFKISMIDAAKNKINDSLQQIKKAFFRQKANNTKDNLVDYYVTDLLTTDRQRLTIEYQGHKGDTKLQRR